MVMHLKELKAVDDAKLRAELPEYLRRLQAYRQSEAFGQWLRKQEEQARVVIPQPQMPVGPAGRMPPQRRS